MSDSIGREALLEDEAALVLDRAADLEARRGREVSVEELRTAALDAGIPLDAFERALSEVRAGLVAPVDADGDSSVPVARNEPGGLSAAVRRGALGALGVGLAGFAHFLAEIFGVPLGAAIQYSLVLSFFAACGLVVARRGDRDVLSFEFDLASLWTGLTLVFMVLDPLDATEVLAGMGLIGAVGGTVGAVLVRSLRPRDARQSPALLQGPADEEAVE